MSMFSAVQIRELDPALFAPDLRHAPAMNSFREGTYALFLESFLGGPMPSALISESEVHDIADRLTALLAAHPDYTWEGPNHRRLSTAEVAALRDWFVVTAAHDGAVLIQY